MKTFSLLCTAAVCVFAYSLVEGGTISTRFSLSFNSVFDKLIAKIHTDATSMNLNPYKVQDINETFKFGLITGGLLLENGMIYGIDTIFRNGNATADLSSESATVTVALGFKDLNYHFDFEAKLGTLVPKGKVSGDITNLYVNAVVLANLKNTSDITLSLQQFKLADQGVITVHFYNDYPEAEEILDVLTDTFTKIFKNLIVNIMEKEVGKMANSTISKMHVDINSLTG